LLALEYVCHVLNVLASATLGWIPPIQALTGQLLVCAFYEPVYYKPHYDGFPSNSNGELGRWVGVAKNVGDALKFKLLTPLKQIIFRSIIWSALDPTLHHKRLTTLGGEKDTNHADDKIFVRSNKSTADDPTIDPKDPIGRTYLKDTESDGQRFPARIVRAIAEKDAELKRDPSHIKFLCEVDGDTANDIYTYNQVLDFIERDNLDIESDMGQMYCFRRNSAHQGPLRTSDRDYNGSTYNILVEWESGETTYEPLDIIANDDGFLDTPGWKPFRHLAKNDKKVERMVNQAKLHSYRQESFWKFGFLVPRTHGQAVEIDL
jgi:hypothetical protein